MVSKEQLKSYPKCSSCLTTLRKHGLCPYCSTIKDKVDTLHKLARAYCDNKILYRGEFKTLKDWSEITGIYQNTLSNRLETMTVEEAFNKKRYARQIQIPQNLPTAE